MNLDLKSAGKLLPIPISLLIGIASISCSSSIGFPTETPVLSIPTASVQPTPTPTGTLLIMTGSNSQTSQVFPISPAEKLEIRWKFFRLGGAKLIMNVYRAGDRTTPVLGFDTGELGEGSKKIDLEPASYYLTVQSGNIQNWTVTLIKD